MPNMRGMGASRRGSPTLGLQTLIDRLQGKPKTRYKLALHPITTDQADYASHVLEKNRGRGRRFADATIAGSIGNPLRRIGGAAIKGGLEAKGNLRQRLVQGAGRAAAKMTAGPELGKSIFEGGIAGAGIKTVQEGLEVGRARRTAQQYLRQPTTPVQQKLAAAVDLAKKKGLGRLGQLITGSRATALGNAATRSNARAHKLREAVGHQSRHTVDQSAATVQAAAATSSNPNRSRGAFARRAGRTNKLVDELAAEHKSRKRVMNVAKGVSGGVGLAGGASVASRVGHKEASTELGRSLYVLTRALEPVAPTPLTPLMDDEVELEA